MNRHFSYRRRTLSRLAAAALLGAGTLAMNACDSSTDPSNDVVRVEITQNPLSQPRTNMLRGVTLKLIAVPISSAENFVDLPITWSSSDNTRATVDANGLVTTVAGGDVTISATAGGKTGTYDINVQYPVGTVAVGPTGQSIRQEGSVTMTATLTGTDGKPAVGRKVTWSSSNPDVAKVNATTGVVSGVADGVANIIATSEGVSGQTAVTVAGLPVISTITVATTGAAFAAVGGTKQLTATAKAQSGTTISGTTFAWTSSSPAVATVDASGLVTCVTAGNSTVSATADNGVGTNVSGSLGVTCATPLVFDVSTPVGNIAESGIATFAVVVPAGTTSLTVTTSGGSGDSDMYAFSPSQTPGTLNTSGSVYPNYPASTFTAVSGNSGNGESITISNPAAGTWRFISYAFTGGGAVSGMSVIATKQP